VLLQPHQMHMPSMANQDFQIIAPMVRIKWFPRR
jgi:hypothetical protein